MSGHLQRRRILCIVLFNLGVRDLDFALGDFLGQHLQLQLRVKFRECHVALSQCLLELRCTGDAVLLFKCGERRLNIRRGRDHMIFFRRVSQELLGDQIGQRSGARDLGHLIVQTGATDGRPPYGCNDAPRLSLC